MSKRTLLLAVGLAALLATGGCGHDPLSPPATATTAAAPDLAPPANPVGLAASGAGRVVKLVWLPNTSDPDLAGYRVYRMSYGMTRLMEDLPAEQTRWIDGRPPAGSYRYAVSAVDICGNESVWTTIGYSSELALPARDARP